ncbi:hypothetical protein DWY31_11885, partial [Dorea sp. AF24-7LB]
PEKGALNLWKACTIALEYSIELGKSGFFALSSLLNGVSISTFLLYTQLIERKSTGNVPVA